MKKSLLGKLKTVSKININEAKSDTKVKDENEKMLVIGLVSSKIVFLNTVKKVVQYVDLEDLNNEFVGTDKLFAKKLNCLTCKVGDLLSAFDSHN